MHVNVLGYQFLPVRGWTPEWNVALQPSVTNASPVKLVSVADNPAVLFAMPFSI